MGNACGCGPTPETEEYRLPDQTTGGKAQAGVGGSGGEQVIQMDDFANDEDKIKRIQAAYRGHKGR